ncbi:MAG TPA: 50S ribosomal protein L9 [Gammaproteobacteria bacterium]|nr:50S ribosomal protein L9 [Gammaproteobacteria bacterium]
MEVILLEKIRNLGGLGDRVKVKRGYGRNYLIPYSKAVYATKENVAKFDERRAELEKVAAEKQAEAMQRKQKIEAAGSVTISAKAGEEGKLFGSVGTRDISVALTKAGLDIEKREIRLPNGAIRMTGEHEIAIELHSDVVAIVKLQIVPEGTHG